MNWMTVYSREFVLKESLHIGPSQDFVNYFCDLDDKKYIEDYFLTPNYDLKVTLEINRSKFFEKNNKLIETSFVKKLPNKIEFLVIKDLYDGDGAFTLGNTLRGALLGEGTKIKFSIEGNLPKDNLEEIVREAEDILNKGYYQERESPYARS